MPVIRIVETANTSPRTILSSELPSPIRYCSWKTGEHEEQGSARLTADGRTLTIQAPMHNLITAYKHAF